MATLLQQLLLSTHPETLDPILRDYIEQVVPALETHFGNIAGLGGSEATHRANLEKAGLGSDRTHKTAQAYSNKPDQSLASHVLNALLIGWELIPKLGRRSALSDLEKRLFCLAITLHDYDKQCHGCGIPSPKADKIPEILEVCLKLGEQLNFEGFWPEWHEYLSDVAFLAQNTHGKSSTNLYPSNWPQIQHEEARLLSPLRHLLTFSDVAVHCAAPGEVSTTTRGDRLRELLDRLSINQRLTYHHLRDSVGLLSNLIHNATLQHLQALEYHPIIYLAQGVIYLAPPDAETPDRATIQTVIWQKLQGFLTATMSGGRIGFKRDGKGLKISPQTREVLSPTALIRALPTVIQAKVGNAKDPATPKRLAKLELTEAEQDAFAEISELQSDRLAELLGLVQKELFFGAAEPFIHWVLDYFNLTNQITPEQTQIQAGGVNYGWYHVAAAVVTQNSSQDDEEFQDYLGEFAEALAEWYEAQQQAEAAAMSLTQKVFLDYVTGALEIQDWPSALPSFSHELEAYSMAKTKAAKQPICSLGSSEFPSEDQMDSVVLFKPQQYSNKNALGERQIKRGISKIWSLEMLLRQAKWSAMAGKFDDQNPVFLSIFPAYVYSPRTIYAIRSFVTSLNKPNLWDVRKKWLNGGLDLKAVLRTYSWCEGQTEAGQFASELLPDYSQSDLPFMATCVTKALRAKTVTEYWIDPIFLSLLFPYLLGVKVVASRSMIPLYQSDQDFRETVVLDGPAGFWSLMGLSTSLRVEDIEPTLEKLLAFYALHLGTMSSPPKANWQDFTKTVQEVVTDVLNVFALADRMLRRDKRDPGPIEVQQYCTFAHIFAKGNPLMSDQLDTIQKLVNECRVFYHASLRDSSHAILLPLTKALENLLDIPDDWESQLSIAELVAMGSGQLSDALDRQEVYKRPLLMDKSIPYEQRKLRDSAAIEQFMQTCIEELFQKMCKGDRAILNEQQNRIKSGFEFMYRKEMNAALAASKADAEE
jgi:CRISPR-associated protein Csc3